MFFRVTFCLVLLFSFGRMAVADSWGHWRGVGGNGVANNAQPPVEFGNSQNVVWKVPIPGAGSGSPVTWGDRLFVVTAVPVRGGPAGKLSFQTYCFNRHSGELLWRKVAVEAVPHQGTHATNGFASASPCTDGQHVYSHFGSRGLYCYTMDGELVWSRDDFGPMDTRSGFGEGSSPALTAELLVVPWDHEGPSSLYAIDKQTGETIWQVPRDEPTCWATPLVIDVDGVQQVITNGQNQARAYDLATGRELWRCGGQTVRPVASPVADARRVYIGSGFRGSFLGAFLPTGSGDIRLTTDVVWTVDRDTPDIGSPLLSSGRLYFYKGQSGLLTCLDAETGKPHYSTQRVPGISRTYASPIAAGGHIYLTDRSGAITVIKDANRFEVVATNQLGEPVDATPAPVGDSLYIRAEKHLYCIRIPDKET